MKKFILCCLLFGFCLFALTACGSNNKKIVDTYGEEVLSITDEYLNSSITASEASQKLQALDAPEITIHDNMNEEETREANICNHAQMITTMMQSLTVMTDDSNNFVSDSDEKEASDGLVTLRDELENDLK